MHRYQFILAGDGDYIVWEKLNPITEDGYIIAYGWTEHTRWLIPGTELDY